MKRPRAEKFIGQTTGCSVMTSDVAVSVIAGLEPEKLCQFVLVSVFHDDHGKHKLGISCTENDFEEYALPLLRQALANLEAR